jgi:hypothetical protein
MVRDRRAVLTPIRVDFGGERWQPVGLPLVVHRECMIATLEQHDLEHNLKSSPMIILPLHVQ